MRSLPLYTSQGARLPRSNTCIVSRYHLRLFLNCEHYLVTQSLVLVSCMKEYGSARFSCYFRFRLHFVVQMLVAIPPIKLEAVLLCTYVYLCVLMCTYVFVLCVSSVNTILSHCDWRSSLVSECYLVTLPLALVFCE